MARDVSSADRERKPFSTSAISIASITRLGTVRDNLVAIVDSGSTTTADRAVARDKLADVDKLLQLLAPVEGDRPPRFLIYLDADSGRRIHAAIAVGDPAVVAHVSITVPGMNTVIAESMRAMVHEAEELRMEALRQLSSAGRGGEDVACIAWLGYDTPELLRFDLRTAMIIAGRVIRGGRAGLPDVARTAMAEMGSAVLAEHLVGLRTTSQHPDMHLSVLGHSYGSLTAALALRAIPHGTVNHFVIYGSPGIGSASVAELGIERRNIYIMESPRDYIADAGLFGGDPSRAGFTRLSVAAGESPDGVHRDGAHGHADYARDGSNGYLRMSGYNLAVIVANLPDRAVRWRPRRS